MNILSLGAGVQSTTLLLMSLHGDMPLYEAAIFADTGAEPDAVYKHLDWLEIQAAGHIKIMRVAKGNIEHDVMRSITHGERCSQPPFFVRHSDEESERKGLPPDTGGKLWRQCTHYFKLMPLQGALRALRGPMRKGKPTHEVFSHIGISLDEIQRSGKASGVPGVTNVYPLIERRMTRLDCVKWLKEHGYPEPPKSACYFCPFHSAHMWREMKERDPETFARAVKFDHALRAGGKLKNTNGEVYLHRSFIPLEEAVKTDADNGQERLFDPFGFQNDCIGMCGV